jgi:Vanillate O-demethylase oxygenase C-terminal domain
MVLRNGSAPVGTDRQDVDEVTNFHVLTPETEKTCHYFFASTRNYETDSAEVNENIRVTRERIFSTEDEPIIRRQQERMGSEDFWDLKPILLKTDEGPVRVRRLLAKLIAKEQEAIKKSEG